MNGFFACFNDLGQSSFNAIYNLPPIVEVRKVFEKLHTELDWNNISLVDCILYDSVTDSLFIASKDGQAIVSKSDISSFTGEQSVEVLYKKPESFDSFAYLVRELHLRGSDNHQENIVSEAIKKCLSYGSSFEVQYVDYTDIQSALFCAYECLSSNIARGMPKAQNNYGLITVSPDNEIIFYHIYLTDFPRRKHLVQYKMSASRNLVVNEIDCNGQIIKELRPLFSVDVLFSFYKEALQNYNKIYSSYVCCVVTNIYDFKNTRLIANAGEFAITKTADEGENVYLLLDYWFDKPMYAKLPLSLFRTVIPNKSDIEEGFESHMTKAPEVSFVVITDTDKWHEFCIRKGELNLGCKEKLLKRLGLGQYFEGISVFKDSVYGDNNHFVIYEGHPNKSQLLEEEGYIGELVLKQDGDSIQINDITVYASGRGVILKILLLLFEMGATEITGESETSAESYWEQYTPLQYNPEDGYKTFTITKKDVLDSKLYQKYIL